MFSGQKDRVGHCVAESAMKDIEKHRAKLHDGAAGCEVIAAEATERAKSELFVRLSQHLTILADEIEKVINSTVTLQ